jgi:thiamine-monophosphate kinase
VKESDIIQLLYPPGKIPLDDCFLWGQKTLITTDSLAEETHFKHEWSSPSQLAHKLVEVNVSDIVSSGGLPTHAFLNLGLSPHSSQDIWIQEFARSLKDRLSKYNVQLSGGDSYASKNTNLALTLLGEIPIGGNVWQRTGGKVGDSIYLTGKIGYSQLGFKKLTEGVIVNGELDKNLDPMIVEGIRQHLNPVSRYPMLEELQKYNIHACMDITDGLIQDAQRMGEASKICLEITMNLLPDFQKLHNYLSKEEILGSGEELELLILSPDLLPPEIAGIPIHNIGKTSERKPIGLCLFQDEKVYDPQSIGFVHF